MRLIHFSDERGAPRLGARTGPNSFIDLTALGLPDTLDALLREGEAGLDAARAAITRGGPDRALDSVRLLPPVLQPSKAFAIGLSVVAALCSWPINEKPLVRAAGAPA